MSFNLLKKKIDIKLWINWRDVIICFIPDVYFSILRTWKNHFSLIAIIWFNVYFVVFKSFELPNLFEIGCVYQPNSAIIGGYQEIFIIEKLNAWDLLPFWWQEKFSLIFTLYFCNKFQFFLSRCIFIHNNKKKIYCTFMFL